MTTYRLLAVAGITAIECSLCGSVSHLPGDVANRYCGRCHLFHEVVAEGRRLLADGGAHECEEWRTFRGRCALCDALLTQAGTFYGITPGGRMLQLSAAEAAAATGALAAVVCRRVADFPNGEPPAEAARGRCVRCGTAIAFNPARFPDHPHVCMQCARIVPLPIP